jgi:pimeloyl-ACP methyl ester carboxylesterase
VAKRKALSSGNCYAAQKCQMEIMRKPKTFALASIACVAAILAAATYEGDRWLGFYVWKLTSGEAHAGRYVSVNNASIYFETFGAGPPALVLHGGAGSIDSMSHQIMALARSHFVIAADSRGHGRSTDSNAPLSYSLMSDDMLKLLDQLQIGRVDVVGWSDGAIIGLDMAMRRPDRIEKLAAISANYDVDGIDESFIDPEVPPAPLRYRHLAPDPSHWPTLYRKLVTMWRTEPHYTLEDLGHIKAPTLIIAGEFDIVKRAHSDQLAKAIPRSQEVIVAGATHTAPNDKPNVINSLILDFLDDNTHNAIAVEQR